MAARPATNGDGRLRPLDNLGALLEHEHAQGAPPAGLAHHLPPDVLAGLGAIGRVARALVGVGPLPELSDRALAELREALELEIAVLYLPNASERPRLLRYVTSAPGDSGIRAREEIAFDEAAWRLAVSSGVPLIFQDEASWLVVNPFEPAATSWLALPLAIGGHMLGVVIGAAPKPMSLDPTRMAVLTLLTSLLSAGIATARLREQIERTEVERQRLQLAAEVHDGLAQDLALAQRELALLESEPDLDQAEASRARLRGAVESAHRLVRARLKDLAAPVPRGGVREAVTEVCERFEARGVPIRLHVVGPGVEAAPERVAALARVLTETLANVERHAEASRVTVEVQAEHPWLSVSVRDDGRGFAPQVAEGPDAGHFGLSLMRRRAQEAGGELEIISNPGSGTRVWLRIPILDRVSSNACQRS